MAADSPAPSAAAAVRRAAAAFAIPGELIELRPYHRGHIHDTYLSHWRDGAAERGYLHQRLNERVFRDIDGLMHNIGAVTRHLDAAAARAASRAGDGAGDGAGDRGLQTLRLVPTRGGGTYHRDAGGAWRTYHYVADTETFDRCDSAERAYQAALAFGAFQAQLADLPPSALVETIPDFFSTEARFEQLQRAAARDPCGRAAGVAVELAFAADRRRLGDPIAELQRTGVAPPRVVHGDTKLNNVLFDRRTGKAACVVDLDTCMPGYSLYDFGDLVRFTAATCAEDERDLAAAGIDMALYTALAAGYLNAAGGFLSPREVALMPLAARLVTLTIGVRFLTDHLQGDVYFKTARPGHNLDRARVQLRLVAEMERREPDMRRAAGRS